MGHLKKQKASIGKTKGQPGAQIRSPYGEITEGRPDLQRGEGGPPASGAAISITAGWGDLAKKEAAGSPIFLSWWEKKN